MGNFRQWLRRQLYNAEPTETLLTTGFFDPDTIRHLPDIRELEQYRDALDSAYNSLADKVTKEFVHLLKDMGCWLVHIGIESGNQEVLDGINKNVKLTQVIKSLKLLKKFDIKTQGFFMIFNIWEKDGVLKYAIRFLGYNLRILLGGPLRDEKKVDYEWGKH